MECSLCLKLSHHFYKMMDTIKTMLPTMMNTDLKYVHALHDNRIIKLQSPENILLSQQTVSSNLPVETFTTTLQFIYSLLNMLCNLSDNCTYTWFHFNLPIFPDSSSPLIIMWQYIFAGQMIPLLLPNQPCESTEQYMRLRGMHVWQISYVCEINPYIIF